MRTRKEIEKDLDYRIGDTRSERAIILSLEVLLDIRELLQPKEEVSEKRVGLLNKEVGKFLLEEKECDHGYAHTSVHCDKCGRIKLLSEKEEMKPSEIFEGENSSLKRAYDEAVEGTCTTCGRTKEEAVGEWRNCVDGDPHLYA